MSKSNERRFLMTNIYENVNGFMNNSKDFYNWVSSSLKTSAQVMFVDRKKWAPSFGRDGNCFSAPVCEWLARDLQREWVAIATADSESATSWVWPYTDMFNCIKPLPILLKGERGRKHRLKHTGGGYFSFCVNICDYHMICIPQFVLSNVS